MVGGGQLLTLSTQHLARLRVREGRGLGRETDRERERVRVRVRMRVILDVRMKGG